MLRAIVAVSSAAALQLAALGAPLLHAHLDDHDLKGHHGATRVHAHLGGHARAHHELGHAAHSDGAAVRESEDPERATGLQFFVAVEPAPFSIPALPQTQYAVPAPLESMMRRPPAVAHSHDPPFVALRSSRAPPLFLS